MERGSDSAAAASPRMQERRGGRSRARGLLQLVHSGRLALGWPDARNTPKAAVTTNGETRARTGDTAIRSCAAIRDHVCGRPYRRRQPADVRSGSYRFSRRPHAPLRHRRARDHPRRAGMAGRHACRRSRPTNSPGWSSWPRRRRRRGRRRGVRAHAVRPTAASQLTTRRCPPSCWWPCRARSGTPRAPRSRCPRSPPGRGCSTTAALVLRGEPGVGKPALLDYVAQRASGCRVTRAAGVQSEMETRLCRAASVMRWAARSPRFVCRALSETACERQFGMSGAAAPDRFLVGLAALNLLCAAAEDRPLVRLVDDAR
jgi:hypothetical protein